MPVADRVIIVRQKENGKRSAQWKFFLDQDPWIPSFMSTLEQRMNQLFQDYRPTLGVLLENYFGAAYLEDRHRIAANQV